MEWNKLQARRGWPAWMSYHLWKWQWELHTKAIMLLLLRPDWLRKNQIIWQHVTPWNLKECCLLKGQQPCRKQPEVYMKDIAVPINIEPSICCRVEFGLSLAIAGENLPASRWGKLTLNGSTMGIIREKILSNGLIHVMPTFNWKEIVNLDFEFEITYTANTKIYIKVFVSPIGNWLRM